MYISTNRCVEVIDVFKKMSMEGADTSSSYGYSMASMALSRYKRWDEFEKETKISRLSMERWSKNVDIPEAPATLRKNAQTIYRFFEALLASLEEESRSRKFVSANRTDWTRGWMGRLQTAHAASNITALTKWSGRQAGWQTTMRSVLQFMEMRQFAELLARYGSDAESIQNWINCDLDKVPSSRWPPVQFCQQSTKTLTSYFIANTLVTQSIGFDHWNVAFQASLDILDNKTIEQLLGKADMSVMVTVSWRNLKEKNPDHQAKIPTSETRALIGKLFAGALFELEEK